MLSRNPLLFTIKSIWRAVKIDFDGTLYLYETSQAPRPGELLNVTQWQSLSKSLEDLPPAYVDLLILNRVDVPFPTLIKIMNSGGLILFPAEHMESVKTPLQKIGFDFEREIALSQSKQYVVFKKNTIPCCGY